MSIRKILIRLSEDVAAKFKAAVPARQRNKFIAELVASAVARREDELARIADAVTQEENSSRKIMREMRDWKATVGDGAEQKNCAQAKPRMTRPKGGLVDFFRASPLVNVKRDLRRGKKAKRKICL